MNLNINDKRKLIFDKINDIDNHNKIVNFIMYHEIKHTINNNGYFINISKLSDTLIDKLYNLILELSENISDSVEQEIKDIVNINNGNDNGNDNNNNNNKINNVLVKDIKLTDFSQKDKAYINKSKNYKFE